MKKIFVIVFLVMIMGINEVYASSETSDQLIIVNKAKNELALYEGGRLVNVFTVATGASSISTPEGKFNVSIKWECPVYYKTKVGGCEEGNPLGPRWIGLDVPGTEGYTYGIHGNNSSWSIGSYASAGCVRMYNWQVMQLFDLVKIGTPVVITNTSESYHTVAANNGYEVKKPMKTFEDITLMKETQAYYGSHVSLILNGSTIKGEVKLLEELDHWVKIRASEGDYWLRDADFVIGKLENVDDYYILKQNSKLYDSPQSKSIFEKTMVSGVYKALYEVNGWSYLHDGKGNYGWIVSSFHFKATEREWNKQKDLTLSGKEIYYLMPQFKSSFTSNMIYQKILGA